MAQPLILEAEVSETGKLHLDLPPDAPRGRVLLTLVPAPALEIQDEDLHGLGKSAEEIASSPEIGSWNDKDLAGAQFVERERYAGPRFAW